MLGLRAASRQAAQAWTSRLARSGALGEAAGAAGGGHAASAAALAGRAGCAAAAAAAAAVGGEAGTVRAFGAASLHSPAAATLPAAARWDLLLEEFLPLVLSLSCEGRGAALAGISHARSARCPRLLRGGTQERFGERARAAARRSRGPQPEAAPPHAAGLCGPAAGPEHGAALHGGTAAGAVAALGRRPHWFARMPRSPYWLARCVAKQVHHCVVAALLSARASAALTAPVGLLLVVPLWFLSALALWKHGLEGLQASALRSMRHRLQASCCHA